MNTIKQIISAAVLLCTCGWSAGAATIVHDYRLQNSLADNLGGPSLVSNGGVLSATGYAFTANRGLSVSGALPNGGDYSVVLDFNFTKLDGYRKILDLHDLTLDSGLYTLQTGLVYFPVMAGAQGALSSGTNVTMVFTRDSATKTIAAYVDGVLQFSSFDFANPAIFDHPGNVVNFFADDTAITGNDPTGSVQRIRLYNGALTASQVGNIDRTTSAPEPGSCALFGTGLLILGLRRRKRPEA
jgi:hypothetical protein